MNKQMDRTCPKCNQPDWMCLCRARDVSNQLLTPELVREGYAVRMNEDFVGLFYKDQVLAMATPGAAKAEDFQSQAREHQASLAEA